MEIDIYDFDKTIVPFDSGTLYLIYCMVHYPWCIFYLPYIGIRFLIMLAGLISFTDFKKDCFRYTRLIPKEKSVKKFWDKYEKKVHPWFISGKKRYSVIISASPDFLLEDISERLGFDKLICTKHDPKTGAIIGQNCRKEEKVRRLYEEFNKDEIKVIDVYSDSMMDIPIFSLATNQCYHIVKSEKIPFELERQE